MGQMKPGLHGVLPPASRRVGLWPQLGLALLAGLATIQLGRATGLNAGAGAVAAVSIGFLAASGLIGRAMVRGYPHARLGACNLVTFIRAALVAALAAPLLAGHPAGWPVVATGGVALALDGLDGRLARRSGLVSDFGARFDMEVDAALALILSLHVLLAGTIGPEVLILGLARYVFLGAGLIWPWLRAALPQRFRRKAICVLQIATLLILQLPDLPATAAIWLARIAAGLLIWSFAADAIWLWRRR